MSFLFISLRVQSRKLEQGDKYRVWMKAPVLPQRVYIHAVHSKPAESRESGSLSLSPIGRV